MTLEDSAQVMGVVGSYAAALHVPLEDVAAALATMTRNGMDAATAGTQVKDLLIHIVKASPQATDEIRKLSKSTGIDLVHDFSQAGLQAKGLFGVLDDVKRATHGNVKEMGTLIPNLRGLLGEIVLTGNGAKDYTAILGDLQKAHGITDESFAHTSRSAAFQSGVMLNRLKVDAIEMGKDLQPVLRDIEATVMPLIQDFGAWARQNPELVRELVKVSLALFAIGEAGKVLVGIKKRFEEIQKAIIAVRTVMKGGGLIGNLGSLGARVGAGGAAEAAGAGVGVEGAGLGGALAGGGAEAGVLAGGAGLAPETLGISLAVAALVAGLIAAYEAWKPLHDAVNNFVGGIGEKLPTILQDIGSGFGHIGKAVGDAVGFIHHGFDLATKTVHHFLEAVHKVPIVGGLMDQLVQQLKGPLDALMAMKDAAGTVVGFLGGIVSTATGLAKSAYDHTLGAYGQHLDDERKRREEAHKRHVAEQRAADAIVKMAKKTFGWGPVPAHDPHATADQVVKTAKPPPDPATVFNDLKGRYDAALSEAEMAYAMALRDGKTNLSSYAQAIRDAAGHVNKLSQELSKAQAIATKAGVSITQVFDHINAAINKKLTAAQDAFALAVYHHKHNLEELAAAVRAAAEHSNRMSAAFARAQALATVAARNAQIVFQSQQTHAQNQLGIAESRYALDALRGHSARLAEDAALIVSASHHTKAFADALARAQKIADEAGKHLSFGDKLDRLSQHLDTAAKNAMAHLSLALYHGASGLHHLASRAAAAIEAQHKLDIANQRAAVMADLRAADFSGALQGMTNLIQGAASQALAHLTIAIMHGRDHLQGLATAAGRAELQEKRLEAAQAKAQVLADLKAGQFASAMDGIKKLWDDKVSNLTAKVAFDLMNHSHALGMDEKALIAAAERQQRLAGYMAEAQDVIAGLSGSMSGLQDELDRRQTKNLFNELANMRRARGISETIREPHVIRHHDKVETHHRKVESQMDKLTHEVVSLKRSMHLDTKNLVGDQLATLIALEQDDGGPHHHGAANLAARH